MKQALQRVRIVVVSRVGEQKERRLPIGVRTVLTELGLAAVRDNEYLPISITTRELARRCGREELAGRATRRSLQEAERLGLIRRAGPVNQLRAHPAWPILLHPAWIVAAQRKQPWAGRSILVPRGWDENDPDKAPKVVVTWPVKTTGAVVLTERKEVERRDHYPPDSSQVIVQASPAVALAGACARGGSDSGEGASDQSIGQITDSGRARRAVSMAALKDFGDRKAVAQVVRLAPFDGEDQYWTWLTESSAAAGWAESKHGVLAGPARGDLEFVLQRRGQKSGERGGTFSEEVVTLSRAANGSTAARERAGNVRGMIEAAYRPLGEHPMLLVDDVKPADLALFEGWRGVAVLETSPGNLQVSMMAPHVLLARETLAVQRELSRRCGLTMASVEPNKLRRFPGSQNYKSSRTEPFITRVFQEPIVGTISEGQLAELLEAHVSEVAENMAGGTAASAGMRKANTPVDRGMTDLARKGTSLNTGQDVSGSGRDWAWVMEKIRRVGDRDRDRLVSELVTRCEARARQGKVGPHADHLRYARCTVDKALALFAPRKPRRP